MGGPIWPHLVMILVRLLSISQPMLPYKINILRSLCRIEYYTAIFRLGINLHL